MSPLYVLWFGWIVSTISWAAAWSYAGNPKERASTKLDYYNRAALTVGFILLLGIHPGLLERYMWLWHSTDGFGWIMTLVAFLGLALAWWSFIAMGRQDRRAVVQSGPYRFVRHPMFVGIIIAAFAHAIFRGTIDAFLGAFLMTYGWYLRAQSEEIAMQEEVGAAAYEDYARRTAMFIPFVW